jgi:hypothetical protein
MSASSKSIARSAAQNGTILSKSVDEEKRYKASSAAQKSIQKPTPLGPPSINSQELACARRQYRITKEQENRVKETFVITLDHVQKDLQKPKPLGPPSINSQELAHSRRQYRIAQEYKRLTKLSKHRDKETFVTTLDLRVPW